MWLFCLCGSVLYGQQIKGQEIEVKGSVKEKETKNPLMGVQIMTPTDFATTDRMGRFQIRVRIGDEMEFRSSQFQTVKYVVKNSDDVHLLVQEADKRGESNMAFESCLDSALNYKAKDIRKSIYYIEQALLHRQARSDKEKQARAYKILGDVYRYHRQYDLATRNYSLSASKKKSVETILAWVAALNQNKEFEQAFALLQKNQSFLKGLTAAHNCSLLYQQAKTAIGLGELDAAIAHLEPALKSSKKHNFYKMYLQCNNLMATIYGQKNKQRAAERYYNYSLEGADMLGRKTVVELQNEVADFYSKNNHYDKEIQLRKKSLEEVSKADASIPVLKNEIIRDSITTQKLNYKIANAYLAQDKYEEAIPFLEESIKKAVEKKDVVIQKDATRKLSEIYRSKGDYDKALETYQSYVSLVDTLYVRKEQELSRVAKLNRDISQHQNRISGLEQEWALQQTKYDLAIKDQELIKVSNQRKQWFIYAMLGGISLLSLVALLFYRNLKQEKRSNRILALKSLRSQMNPHFIFNALNSVNSFIAQSDERKANKFISDFSKLMRSVLENSEQDLIPLKREIELLKLYVKLEHSRFLDVFDYHFEIDANLELDAYQLPPMLLQPFIENAIWYGLRYKELKGKLEIRFERDTADRLLVSVMDDGIGRKASSLLKTKSQKKKKSKGMANVKGRVDILNNIYGDSIGLEVTDWKEDGSGTLVRIWLNKNLQAQNLKQNR